MRAKVTKAWYDPKVRGEVHFDMDPGGGQWVYTIEHIGNREHLDDYYDQESS